MMAVYTMNATRNNLYGSLSAEFEPSLTIKSGDTVRYSCFDAGWGTASEEGKRIKPFDRRDGLDPGHALSGPIKIKEAKKGMVLEVKINDIIPGPYGFNSAGEYPNWQNQKLNLTQYKEITLNWTSKYGRCHGDQWSHIFRRLKPIYGYLCNAARGSGYT